MRESSSKYPVRIVQMVYGDGYSGVDRAVMDYYRHINREKVQFDFIMSNLDTSPHDDEILSLGGKLFKIPYHNDSISANLKAFRDIIVNSQYSIIHCHMTTLNVFWLREAKKAGISVRISHSHAMAHLGEGIRQMTKYLLKPFSKRYATHYFSCGEAVGRWFFGDRAFNAGKVTIIPPLIDVYKYKLNITSRELVRRTLNLTEKYVIGHVGRFMYQKNHTFLLKVFAKVHKQLPCAVLMLVGVGELKQEIEDLVDRMGLRDAVLFLGSRQDVHELYQAMDVFAFPSYYEGFPAVLVEAQTAGLPCVLSNKVTEEAALFDSCIRIPLKTEHWVKSVLAFSDFQRIDHSEDVINKGHDISRTVKKLEMLYLKTVSE